MGLAVLAVVAMVGGPGDWRAWAEPLEDLGLAEQRAFRAAADRVAPSVVRIEMVGGLERVGEVEWGRGPTTGLIVTPDGFIVSSALSFVHRPDSILVQLPDATRKPARRVATDHNRMIVLLKIEPDQPLPVPEAAPLAELKVGQWTIAMGRTFETHQPNLAVGMLSATQRIWGKAVQTDAAVSPNNYGGPLVDVHGRVIGVLVPLSPVETSEMAGIEWYDSGIGFAIPLQTILELLPRLREGKDLWPGLIGIVLPWPTLYTADSVIPAVRPRSPAHKAGLRAGDRIVAIDGRAIHLAVQIKQELGCRYAGDRVRLTVLRGSERIERELQLVDRLDPYQHPFFGILPQRNPAVGSPEKPTQPTGVMVRYVYPGGPAEQAGIRAGDLVVAIGSAVQDADQMRSMLAEYQPGDKVSVALRRAGMEHQAEVVLGTLPEAVPPGPLPPPHPSSLPAKPSQANAPPPGTIQLKVPGLTEPVWAYVPQTYHPLMRYGVLIWFGTPGRSAPQAFLANWKSHCDRDGLILILVQPTDASRWLPRQQRIVPLVLAHVAARYAVDPNRVVVGGAQSGGTLALTGALRYRHVVRAGVAIDAPAEGTIPENDPAHSLSFYMLTAEQSRAASLVQLTINRLRESRYPVTVKSLGQQGGELTPEQRAELARWIDSLDRI